jgi:hypothetical protein
MATALDLITEALHLIGAKDPTESVTNQEASDGLVSLNGMLDSWTTDRMFVYNVLDTTHTWPGGVTSRTVGTGGDINIARPVKVQDSYMVAGGVSYPINAISKEAYAGITLKGLQSTYPDWLYYETSYPLGVVYLNPVPGTSIEFHLLSWLSLVQFAAVTDVVSLPPGYKRAVVYNLAIEVAGQYGLNPSAAVAAIATSSAYKIKRLNAPLPLSTIEVAYAPSRDNFNIYRGW